MKKRISLILFLTCSIALTKAQSKSDVQYLLHNFCNKYFYNCYLRTYQNIDLENLETNNNTITAYGKVIYKNFLDITDKNNFKATIKFYKTFAKVFFYKQSWSPFRESGDEYYWELCEKTIFYKD